MTPGLHRDPYLRPVCERWGEAAAHDAGWFDDGDRGPAPLDDTGWLCTPVAVVQRAASSAAGSPAPVVLLSTGGFFPVHQGHVAMMAAARRCLEGTGRRVLGGYLSPGHDDYIALKCGSVTVPVSERLAQAEAAVAPTGWLSIDPWEALARRVAVTYTDVSARLEAYLRAHVDPAIDVIYVCGGDNARFALAFTERGGCVVVGRPGNEATVERWRTDPRVAGNPRVHWADGEDPASSSALRDRLGRDDVPHPASGRAGRTHVQHDAAAKRRVTLRLEDERAVATLALPGGAWRRFQDGLRAELATRVALHTVTLEAQDPAAGVVGTVSLDPMLPAEIDLGISRVFDLGGYRALGHTNRPGAPPVPDQLAAIPPGRWALRDDDRATGSTVRFVLDHLPAGVTIAAPTFALEPDPDTEIADSRDFLLGTDDGGLVVALPDGRTGRAPYLLPYVDPAVRSGLPGGDAVAFSLALWELGAAIFATADRTVATLPTPVARTLAVAGFHPTDRLTDVCATHAAVLRTLLRS